MTRAGSTLVELIVVLALLGVMSAVTVLALRVRPAPAGDDAAMQSLMDARKSAIRDGHRVTIELRVGGTRHHATAHPDGRVVTTAPFGVNPLSGRSDDAAR